MAISIENRQFFPPTPSIKRPAEGVPLWNLVQTQGSKTRMMGLR